MNIHTVNKAVSAVITILLLAIVTSAVTLLYWLSGGEFKRSSELVIYSMALVYVWALVFKVAREKYLAEKQKIKELGCPFCGLKAPK